MASPPASTPSSPPTPPPPDGPPPPPGARAHAAPGGGRDDAPPGPEPLAQHPHGRPGGVNGLVSRWVSRWFSRWSSRLYVRVWLAVVTAVAVLTVLVGWLWRQDLARERAERPGREIVIYNADGEVLGQAPARPMRAPGGGAVEFQVRTRDGQTLVVQLPRPRHMQPPASPAPWHPQALGFTGMLVVLALAVALGIYPVVRRLTRRLEQLQTGVERWGHGDLSARLPEQGQDEVAFLAQRFNVAAERVQQLLQAHKTLLAHASHELRSPLARIRLALALLDPTDPQRLARQQAEMARNIAELDQLIDEILLASRLDAQPDAERLRERVDLAGLAAEECARTGVWFDCLAQPQVDADPRLLRRLLRNLLENAVRHGQAVAPPVPTTAATDPERPGDVRLWLDVVTDGGRPMARLTVDDRGPGVPPALREQVFEPFFRLPGASEQAGGVGLGLALVRRIARQHGGDVMCTARPGGGARFVATLPALPPA